MSCIITLSIGDNKPIEIEVEQSELGKEAEFVSSQEITSENILLQNIIKAANKKIPGEEGTELDNIKKTILAYLNGIYPGIQVFKFNKDEDTLVPNANTDYLKELYPDIDFPKNMKFPILLVDRLGSERSYGLIAGKVYITNDQPLYVVRNTKASVMRLANHLKLRGLIKGKNSVIKNLEESLQDELKEIADKLEMQVDDMLLDYSEDQATYNKQDIVTSTKRSIKTVLTETLDIINKSPQKQHYSNPILNEVANCVVLNKEQNYLDLNKVFKYLQKVDLLKDFKNGKDFIDTFNKTANEVSLEKWNPEDEFEQKLKQLLEEKLKNSEDNGLAIFIQCLFSTRNINDPIFKYKPTIAQIKSNNDRRLLLDSSDFTSYNSVYGLTYETMRKATPKKNVGSWTIYSLDWNDTVVYIPSRHVPKESDDALMFPTEKEAEEYAKDKIEKTTLREDAIGNIKVLNRKESEGRSFSSNKYYPKGSIIKTLDGDLDIDALTGDLRILFNGTFKNFNKYMIDRYGGRAYEILMNIDSGEKAAVFLDKLRGKDLNNVEEIIKVSQEIKDLNYRFYYVRDSNPYNGEYRTYVIPMPDTLIINPPKDPRVPVIQLLDQVAKMMQKNFGVEVKVLTQTEINQLKIEKGQEVNEGDKAFIYDGVIYVNSTYADSSDLFHEYSHLFMGVVKKSNPKWYAATLDRMLEISKTAKSNLENKMKMGRSYYDAVEEVFADLYGEYLQNNLPITIEKLFDSKIMSDTAHSIFDLADSTEDMPSLLRTTKLGSLFRRFSSDIAIAYKNNNNLLHDDSLALQRRKSNWLEAQLKLYKQEKEKGVKDEDNEGIKEEC